MIGRTIAHYEITGKLGEGAMGQVYQATDTRLKRKVALKMLSPRFASDPERVARLRREAEVMATLNHAHIGQIYGLEPADDSLALVLELVEGPTLEDRLRKGPLPLEQALRIAQQVAAALELAHERGIIHRDLKPTNVKLTHERDVKVLDFGLAKGMHVSGDRTALTADGAVIGTPAYMSPEQIEGRVVDRRADIWSFGCVLFEMLTGVRPFTADSVGSLFARIATESADLGRLAGAPAPVRRLIERCLRKDPKTRLRDIGDARVELEDLLAGRTETAAPAAPSRRRLWPGALGGLLVGVVVGGLAVWSLTREPEREPPAIGRYSMILPVRPAGLRLECPTDLAPPLAVSPDGLRVVFAGQPADGERRLYLRSASDPKIEPIPRTEGAEVPFFSPDGKHVGFLLHGAADLYRIALVDHSVRKVCSTSAVRGASWGRDGTIIYADTDRGLVQVSLSGEDSRSLTRPTADERDHRWPQVLPDGRRVLFTASMRDGRLQPRILSLETGTIVPIDVQGLCARYLPGGYLIYMRSNTLWARRIDLEAGRTIGDPVIVAEGIHVSELGNPHLAVSPAGVLVYEPVRPPSPGKRLVWVDRQGQEEVIDTGKGYEFPRLSPDGRKVLFANHTDTGNHDIYTIDLTRDAPTKLTNAGNYIQPIWSPDGGQVAFCSFAKRDLYTLQLGESTPRKLVDRAGWQYALQWTEENCVLLSDNPPSGGWDIVEYDVVKRTFATLVATADNERAARISPNRRWLAYVSDETGRNQVYLRSYRTAGQEEPVSLEGGTEPVWSSDSRELFFRNGRALLVAEIAEREGLSIGVPREMFRGPYVAGFFDRPNYDVAENGKRFVMVDGGWGLTSGRLDVHLHFDRELQAALPQAK